ncbi:MAG TPA: lysophospholipid acyltransferase family protein [Thermodesulfobacteriota bacterium]
MFGADRITLLKIFFVPLAYFLLRLYLSMIRVRTLHEDTLLQFLQSGRKGVGAVWHQRFLGVLGYVRKFSYLSLSIMISRSRDGDWVAPVARWIGLRPVRGSSTRGGKEALAAMVQDLSQNQAALHIVDGPQGPKGVVKAGLIRLAQLSKAVIVPIYISVDRAWVARSWDRFLIPKPFSRVLVRFGEPIDVPEQMDSEAFEALRLEVEKKMIEGHAQDDLNFGWEKPL